MSGLRPPDQPTSGPADPRPRGPADFAGTQPPLLYPAYQSTVLRAPSKPLIQLPRNFTDLAAPLFGTWRSARPTTT